MLWENGAHAGSGLMFFLIISVTLPATTLMQPAAAQTAETPAANTTSTSPAGNERGLPDEKGFTEQVLATNFSSPHNILFGPDGALWITERVGMTITRVNPVTGETISNTTVPGVHQSGGQDGLMGMTFDPNFNETQYIYVAYTYDAESGEELDRRTKITRFTYEAEGAGIGQPLDLISGLSGSVDHNSGRIIFGPDGKLYYTIGDQGNNQFDNYCIPIRSQVLPSQEDVESMNWSAYEGKVLRLNPDGSIPDDNPEIDGVKSHIFTYGHRNAQGIAVGENGLLYVSEHGDKSDDEFNRLQAGGNYGWPNVQGYKDDQAYQFANWSAAQDCASLTFNNIPPFPPSVPVMNESEFDAPNFVPPIQTFYTVENDYNFTNPPDCGYVCWPTVAPSSLRFYNSTGIPEWNNSLLMTTLKAGKIFLLKPDQNGTSLAGDPIELFHSENRYRDIAFGPDGRTVYVITDSAGPVQAIAGGPIAAIKNPGSVIVFTYDGNATSTR
jgi:PQQ-dependent dehydrogenase (s-GDH family)